MISIRSKENNMKTPTFNDLIFIIFMQVTIVDRASTSFMTHIPSVAQYKIIAINPNKKETISKILIKPYRGWFKNSFFVNHRIYDVHTMTPMVPIILPIIFNPIDVRIGKRYAKIEPKITKILNTTKNLLVTSMPNPLYDHARL